MRNTAVSIYEGLLVYSTNPFHRPNKIRVLRAEVPWMVCFNLTVCLFLRLHFLQSCNLVLGKQNTFLCRPRLQSLEAFTHGFKIVTQPNRPHTARRHNDPPLQQFL